MASIQMMGLASGIDTKAIVESMLESEKSKINKVNQDKQILEWRQELYREMIDKVSSFTKKYFDPINRDKFIMGSNSLNSIVASSNVNATVANVIASSNAIPGSYKLDVSQMAEKAKHTGSTSINQATVKNDINIPIVIDSNNNDVVIDGVAISINENVYKDSSSLASEINSKMEANEELKGKYKVEVTENGDLEVSKKLIIGDDNSKVKVSVGDVDYDITLKKGSYTPKELSKEIENKLKASTGSDGNKFNNENVKVEAKDGQVVFTGATTDKEFKFENVDLSKSEAGTSGSDTTILGNKLSYKKEFVGGVNSELVISVRGENPVIVDLSKVDLSGTKEESLKNISDEINKNSSTVKTEIIDGKLVFKTNSKEQIVVSGSASNAIGIKNTLDMTLDINIEKMESILKFDDPNNKKVEFTINGKEFKYDFGATEDKDGYKAGSGLTIKDVFSDISSKADVNISYNTISRSFSIESKTSGKDISLSGSDTNGNFLNSVFGVSEINATGKNAVVEFSDSEGNSNIFEFSSNKFNLSGIDFDIKTMPTETIEVNIDNNPEKTVELVKEFVNDYNEIMDELNTKTKERTNSKYKPLTQEQKDQMTEKEIELWESRAKEGLLGNESELENFMYSLRSAIFTPVSGSDITLQQIGITTSNDYRQGGKIIFDEEKFTNALKDNPNAVSDLFVKPSSSGNVNYDPDLSLEDKNAKNADQGIFRRINDVLNDYVRFTRDDDGKKGIFIEIAGIKGDTTVNMNRISRAISEHDKKLERLNDIMNRRESRYYREFAAMEAALSKMQSQASMFAQPMG